MCGYPRMLVEDVAPPNAGVAGSCEPSVMGYGVTDGCELSWLLGNNSGLSPTKIAFLHH